MDWDKIATLLDVVHKAAAAGPAYSWFGSVASAELRKVKEEVTPQEPPPPPYVETQLDLALKGKL